MLNTAVENYYFIQIFVIVKSIPRQFIFFSWKSCAKALKLYSSERKRVFMLIGSDQISLRGFVSERE